MFAASWSRHLKNRDVSTGRWTEDEERRLVLAAIACGAPTASSLARPSEGSTRTSEFAGWAAVEKCVKTRSAA